jgi:hypothetical protein
MKPNFLIIGAQKSASTFIHNCVREHPEAFLPRYETPFFEDPYFQYYQFDDFETLFSDVSNEYAIGIKRPDYLGKPEVPKRISNYLPGAKFIIVLRNPVYRAISAYFWYMQTGDLPIKHLEQGLQEIIQGDYKNTYPKADQIIDYGFYHHHLSRYFAYFDKNQFLIMLHEEFKTDPPKSIKEVYKFLQIDENFIPTSLSKRPKQTIYSLFRIKWHSIAIKHFFYSYIDVNNNYEIKIPSGSTLKRSIYYSLIGIDRFFLKQLLDNSKPELSDQLLQTLTQVYLEDINNLESCLNIDLTAWKNLS